MTHIPKRSNITRRGLIAAGALALPLSPGRLLAGEYPDRPINYIVTFPPGGGADVFGRIIAKGLETAIGQPVIPINKPGAGSLIGTNYVKNARPDGYTLLFATTAFLINTLVRPVDYDPVRDFDLIGMVARAGYALLANPKLGFAAVSDLIAYAKANPGALRFGSPGIGASGQLAGDLLRHLADIKFLDVRYKGNSEAVLATMSGEVGFCFESPAAVISNIKTGRLTMLATAGEKRDLLYPQVQAISEVLPGYAVWSWFGLVGPHGMPPQALQVLRSAAKAMAAHPVMRQRLAEAEVEPFTMTAQEFTDFITSDRARWANIISRDSPVN